ncbi:MAG: hypothetical protein R3C11_00545 [Planctomycetaceae bacterium]
MERSHLKRMTLEPLPRKKNLLARFGPGLLVAATGVGAGDLAGGASAGSKLGTTILWAVIIGAALKFVLTEGLARGSWLLEKPYSKALFAGLEKSPSQFL